MDEDRFTVLGGDSDAIATRFGENYDASESLKGTLASAVLALGGPERKLGAHDLEVAVLQDKNGRRTFRRITGSELSELLEE
jgi:hypothetical protein